LSFLPPALAVALALLLALLLGRALLRALAGPALASALGRPGEAAFALLTGVTALSILLGVAYAASAPVPGLLVALAALGCCAWLARRRGATAPGEPSASLSPVQRAGLVAGWLLLAALVALLGTLSWHSAAAFPDAYQVWLLRGRVLFLDGGFGGRYFEAFTGAHDNRAYPPLLSLATAGLYEAIGAPDDRAAKLLPAALLAALLLVAHGALRRSLPRGASLALTLGLGACATLGMVTIWGIADLPVAAHLLCGGVLLLAVEEDTLCARLLALPLLGVVLSKNEGLPAALALLGGLGLRLAMARLPARRIATALARCALPALAAVGAWWGLTTSRGLPLVFTLPASPAAHEVSRLARLRAVLDSVAERLADFSWLPGFAIFALVLPLVLVLAARGEARRRTLAAGGVVLLLVAAYLWVLSGYRGNLPYLLRFSTGRLIAHFYPLAFVVGASGLALLARGSRTR
jgi:hypothetical protein